MLVMRIGILNPSASYILLFLPLLVLIQNICTFRSVSDHEEELYTPAFNSVYMNIVFTLLLPHLSRWKSLCILTDCWAPMYTALTAINPFITRLGAPLLESLSLMRCNEFISFSPHFQPQQLKEPEFLNRGGQNSDCASGKMIPSLKCLLLRGVHVDWNSLASETGGLIRLEIKSLSQDVRPSLYQVLKILSSSIGLRNLVLSASGPTSSLTVQNDRASLPHLRKLTIGYRTATDGLVPLELIHAPYTEALVLEDATCVGDLHDIDAAPLLSYIGTKTPFPLLEQVTLTRVKTPLQPFREFLSSLPDLQHLELKRMSMADIHALQNCCPKLQSLCIRNFEQLDADFIGNFDRQTKGGPLDATATDCVLPPTCVVTIISDEHPMEEGDDHCFNGYYSTTEEIQLN